MESTICFQLSKIVFDYYNREKINKLTLKS